MELLTGIGILSFFIRLTHKGTGLLWLWWRKEYRPDRMLVHIKTKQGINLFFGKTNTVILLFFALGIVTGFTTIIATALAIFIVAISFFYIKNKSSWLFAPISPKIIALFLFFVGIISASLFVFPFPLLFTLTLVDILLFPLSFLFVLILNSLTLIYHGIIIRKSVGMLRSHTPMTVIGITGSYGKTSVKEYLATILSQTTKTLKTPASKNSPIGIAETVLSGLKPETKIFVVEMGAYKKGEIREMTKMVHPHIGIITAINPQHQDLFGSIENTIAAKYELIQGLTGSRIAVINWDDEKTRAMGKRAQNEGVIVWWYSKTRITSLQSSNEIIFFASNIESNDMGVAFDCHFKKHKVHIAVPVLGEHQVSNILAAVAASVASGVDFTIAARAASRIKGADKVMEKIETKTYGIFINDTFNNNPDAARAALSYLSSHKGKKYLVFQPMIELGAYANESHESVGKFAGNICNAIILTNSNHFKSFEKGVRSANKHIPVLVLSPDKGAEYLRKHTRGDSMTLFKGKDAEHILKILYP